MRYFIDTNGRAYKAEDPKSPEDMERMNPSQEQLDALPSDGKSIVESKVSGIIAKMENRVEVFNSKRIAKEIDNVEILEVAK